MILSQFIYRTLPDRSVVRFDRTELTIEFKNNQEIRKSSGTVGRDELELVRLSSVRFDSIRNPLKVR